MNGCVSVFAAALGSANKAELLCVLDQATPGAKATTLFFVVSSIVPCTVMICQTAQMGHTRKSNQFFNPIKHL